MTQTTILITGAAGVIGTVLRRGLARPDRHLRLLDRRTVPDVSGDEMAITADLGDTAALARASDGVDAVIHLAGQPRESDWDTLLAQNISGTVNVYEAARGAGVARILYASSNHVTGYWPSGQHLTPEDAPRPDSRYAATKLFGEALARLYADKYGIRGWIMRIGSATPLPKNRRGLSTWISPDDMVRLVETGLTAEYHLETVYGVSANQDGWYDMTRAAALGFHPQDDAASAAPADVDGPDHPFQGGRSAEVEFVGEPTRLLP